MCMCVWHVVSVLAAVTGWISVYFPGQARCQAQDQHQGGWACVWSGKQIDRQTDSSDSTLLLMLLCTTSVGIGLHHWCWRGCGQWRETTGTSLLPLHTLYAVYCLLNIICYSPRHCLSCGMLGSSESSTKRNCWWKLKVQNCKASAPMHGSLLLPPTGTH